MTIGTVGGPDTMIVEAVGDEQMVGTPGCPTHPLPHGGGTATTLVVVEPGAGAVAVGGDDCNCVAGTVVATGGTVGGLVAASGGLTTSAVGANSGRCRPDSDGNHTHQVVASLEVTPSPRGAPAVTVELITTGGAFCRFLHRLAGGVIAVRRILVM
jgi:hypothetical protein